jgi:hypothetical protein
VGQDNVSFASPFQAALLYKETSMKSIGASILLVLLSVASATAQIYHGGVRRAGDPPAPAYCSPCLFYSGDFDPNGPDINELLNGSTIGNDLGTAVIYIPFVIPAGQTWTVKGLFINEMVSDAVLDPPEASWSISTGLSTGVAGTVVASGRGPATLTPTGRSWGGRAEFTFQVSVKEFQLQSGKYWLSVLPQCTNSDNPDCQLTVYAASDVEDNPPPNFKGGSPINESYFTYARDGGYYLLTAGNGGVCGVGCNRFSAGAVGVARSAGH